ncbi:hypothetical protein VTJ04DRAFT_475 [Mycothermus thermophilus]|uniref:uncharacterized protein n=1 Tax=Humicola insolens TaxID=85995 RepID=UPI0037438CAA
MANDPNSPSKGALLYYGALACHSCACSSPVPPQRNTHHNHTLQHILPQESHSLVVTVDDSIIAPALPFCHLLLSVCPRLVDRPKAYILATSNTLLRTK